MAYISVINYTCYKLQFFSCYRSSVGSFHVLHQHLSFWLVGTYSCCCSSVFLCGLESHMVHFHWYPVLFILVKSHHPSCFSLHLSSLTCCVWNVVIRGSGVDHLIGILPRTTSCWWMPPWRLFLPPPLVLVSAHFEDLLFTFWSHHTLPVQYHEEHSDNCAPAIWLLG